MIETLRKFKTVSPDDVSLLSSYYEGFRKTRKFPRFYMAPLWLGTKSEFIWGVVDDCLCVVKRRVMYKNPVIYLILPPMHRDGNVSAELSVLKRFWKCGIGARVSEEDVSLYHIEGRVTPDNGNMEYIYRAGDYLDLSGKKNSNWRHQLNELSNECEITSFEKEMSGYTAGFESIDLKWKSVRNLSVNHAKKIRTQFSDYAKVSRCRGYLIRKDGVSRSYGLTQQIIPGWVGILLRQHDFSDTLSDSGRAQHLIDTRWWAEEAGPDTLMDIGAGVGVAGLDYAKNKLRPTKVMQIYKLEGAVKLSMKDYRESEPVTESGGFGLT